MYERDQTLGMGIEYRKHRSMKQKIIVNNLFNPTTEESWVYKKYKGMKKGKQFYEDLTPEQQIAWQEEVKHIKRKSEGSLAQMKYADWVTMQLEHDSMFEFLTRSFFWIDSVMGYDYWYVVAMSAPHRKPNNGKKQTATDWLWDQFVNKSRTDYANMLREADAMHREQVMEAWQDGSEVECQSDISVLWRKTSYDYYNEKYATDYGTE